jgi:hypothetical protein
MLDDIRKQFAAGLYVHLDDVMVGEAPPHPECLCVIVMRDVDPEDMDTTLRQVLPRGQFTRACVQVIEPDLAYRLRGLSFAEAWDLSWDLLIATVRYE